MEALFIAEGIVAVLLSTVFWRRYTAYSSRFLDLFPADWGWVRSQSWMLVSDAWYSKYIRLSGVLFGLGMMVAGVWLKT